MSDAATCPVRVDATLDSHLNRWLWLVKWLLATPHYVVLLFLWVAFVVVSVVGFFAIYWSSSLLSHWHLPDATRSRFSTSCSASTAG